MLLGCGIAWGVCKEANREQVVAAQIAGDTIPDKQVAEALGRKFAVDAAVSLLCHLLLHIL